jgi:hypothetical protein
MVNEQFTIVNITHLLEREPNLGLNIPFLDPATAQTFKRLTEAALKEIIVDKDCAVTDAVTLEDATQNVAEAQHDIAQKYNLLTASSSSKQLSWKCSHTEP